MARVSVFADEAGDFNFSTASGASQYFILTTVTMEDLGVGDELLNLRRQLAWEGAELRPEGFHATYDKQAVRDRVFEVLARGEFRVDATILEKRKAQPHLTQDEIAFYKLAWYLHFQYVARLRIPDGDYYVPDLCVIPRAMQRRLRAEPGTFEVYDDPVPLVVEIWSPSTGRKDIKIKLLQYRARGDTEVWRIQPYERPLTAWRRQADGSYAETLHTSGIIRPVALPDVAIEVERLFD